MTRRLAAALAAALVLAACGGGDPPPRNPLATSEAAPTAEATPAPATATPAAPSAPSPTPAAAPGDAATPTPAPTAEDASAPDARTVEAFTGTAIELMAEWLGVPSSELGVESAEGLVWPDACAGTAPPNAVCAAVLTPGYRVVLSDAYGNVHGVHAAVGGLVRWRGEETATGEVASAAGGAIAIATDGGGEIALRAAPGTRFEDASGPLAPTAIAAGQRVAAGFDGSPRGGAEPVLAWLVVLERP